MVLELLALPNVGDILGAHLDTLPSVFPTQCWSQSRPSTNTWFSSQKAQTLNSESFADYRSRLVTHQSWWLVSKSPNVG